MNINLTDRVANNIYLFIGAIKNQGLDFKLWYRLDKVSSKFESISKSVNALFIKIKTDNPHMSEIEVQSKLTDICNLQSADYNIDLIPFDLLADSGIKGNFDTLKPIIAFPEEEISVKESDVKEANIVE